jgi:choline transporter-like protein 2/4/5
MGGCGKCFGSKAADDEKKKSNPLEYKRTCTDILCLIFFVAFCGLLLAIFLFALNTGDIYGLLYDADYKGDRCGTGKNAGKKKAFYPRIPRDMAEQNDVVAKGNFFELELYALCVSECPTGFSITNPQTVIDYGYDPDSATTQALGSGTRAQWISAVPTVDMLNRCIPRSEASTDITKMCAYPACDDAEAIGVGATCTSNPDFGKGWEVTTQAQKDVCIVQAKQSTSMQYGISASDEASQAMLASVANAVGGVFEIASSLAEAYPVIIAVGIALPVVIAFAYMVLLYLFAPIMIWTLLILLVILELIGCIVCFIMSGIAVGGVSADTLMDKAKNSFNVTVPDAATEALSQIEGGSTWGYTFGFWVLLVVSGITIITIAVNRKKIRICAAIITESTKVFKDMPFLMLFPTWGTIAHIGITIWFIFGLLLLYTLKAEAMDVALGKMPNETYTVAILGLNSTSAPTVDPVGGLRDLHESGSLKTVMGLIHLYGYFTLVQWVQGMSWVSMSAAVGWWFYFKSSGEHPYRWPIANSVAVQFTFHAGSVAFAAFIIAIFDVIRTVVAYVEKQMEKGAGKNFMVWLAFKCIMCCVDCLKRTVKFISYYGLVFVAVNGNSFCGGCFKTFGFFFSNAGQVAINALVISVVRLLAYGTSPLFCALVGFFLCEGQGLANPFYPALLIFITAFVMTASCMTVFECVVTTVFVCSFEDKASFGGKYLQNHPALAKALNVKEKKGKKGAPAAGEDEKLQSV